MAQDTTRGARSLMDAVATVAPDLESRRVAKDGGPKGAPPLPGAAVAPPPLAKPFEVSISESAKTAEPAAKTAEPARAAAPQKPNLTPPPSSQPSQTAAAKPTPQPTAASAASLAAPTAKPAPSAIKPAASDLTELNVAIQIALADGDQQRPTAAKPMTTAPLAAAQVERAKPKVVATTDVAPPVAPIDTPVEKAAKRRPAGPSRGTTVAANDDAPTIGGLIYALNQKPSRRIYTIAAAISGLWLVVGALLSTLMILPELAKVGGAAELFGKPVILISLATVVLPIAVFWVIAWLVYQAQDLRLRSSAMTEVAIRLAEPDRQAEQAVASLGQTVRKQVNYMNEAISQAIGRAGELEAMVHSEVSALEQAFASNETRIRGLLNEFANQRNELSGTGENVHRTLRAISSEVPQLLENLQNQQAKIARLVGDAGQNLIALDTSLTKATGQFENTLDTRTTALRSVLTDTTSQMQGMLGQSTEQIQTLLGDRTTHLQTVLDEYTSALHTTLGTRTGEFQTVFETFTAAIDQTLATRSDAISTSLLGQTEAFDQRLLERTRAIDLAFATRLNAFDDSIRTSTQTIDSTVGEKARLLAVAMDAHAKNLSETLNRQSQHLDEQLVQGIASVRRTSENITRQSVKAIEGLAGQADMLKTVSENLLTQIGSVTNRFENQGQSIIRAANALEQANHRIDSTLQNRHRELTDTLGRVTESTDQLGKQMVNYKSTIETSLTEAAQKTRALTDDLTRGAQTHAQSALNDLQRLRTDTEQQQNRALDSLRDQFSTVSQEMSQQVGSLTSRLAETTDEIRARTRTAAEELGREQEALRQQAQAIPDATRQSTDAMRRVLAEQLKALDEVARIADREKRTLDIAPPVQHAIAPPAAPVQQPQRPNPPPQQAVASSGMPPTGWSLGDLLARASKPEAQAVVQEPHQAPATNAPINLEQVAAALDPPTAAAIWARFRSGQRGILVRSIYSAEGRAIFDDAQRRYQTDMPFRAMVDRFLSEFEREVRDVEARDPSGQSLQAHLTSSSGRVYLFLAHACGRIS